MTVFTDGSQLIVAVGVRVLVYDALDGDLLHSLKGKNDLNFCCRSPCVLAFMVALPTCLSCFLHQDVWITPNR